MHPVHAPDQGRREVESMCPRWTSIPGGRSTDGIVRPPRKSMQKLPATDTIRTKIHGVTFPNSDGVSRQKLIRKYCRAGKSLEIIPEPKNRHDRNALGLWVKGRGFFFLSTHHHVGYVSSELAAELKPELKKGAILTARILEVTGGGWFKSYGVNIELTLERRP